MTASIRTVLVVGAGSMGRKVALQCALGGYDVVLHDIIEQVLVVAEDEINTLAQGMIDAGTVDTSKVIPALSRITLCSDPTISARNADILCECIPEDPDAKGRLFARFDCLCPDHTLFTTNTSTLLPSMFAEDSGRPDRLLALHFHNPPMDNIVDVMPHAGTAPENTRSVVRFAETLGLIPILVKKETRGYVFTNLFMTLLDSALTMAQKNVAAPEDIDRAWMGGVHATNGPFALMDQVGLDTVWEVADSWARFSDNTQMKANADFVKQYIEKGYLGVKSGKGFYVYAEHGQTESEENGGHE